MAMAVAVAATELRKTQIDPDDSTKGSIVYKGTNATEPAGLFVTTYYFRDTDCADCKDFKGQDQPWTKTDIYKTGILQYLKASEKPDFAGWKVLIYTDKLSLENPTFRSAQDSNRAKKHSDEWAQILNHPNVLFGEVDWPEYAVGSNKDNKTIDNAILRALRMKALHDFPKIPVFVRDADTLFENIVKVRPIVDELAIWESTLLKTIKGIFEKPGSSYKMIIASQPNYHRQWHVHPETGVQTSGCYAAVTSTLGGIPEWADGSLWRKCLTYIRAHTKVITSAEGERTPDNIGKPTYIGKDEQLLSYVILQEIFDRVYFYYLEYIQVEGNKIVDSSGTPFAKELIAAGFERYPSPYIDVLKEQYPPLEESVNLKRKDANEVTEGTILKPEIIPLSLSEKTHQVLQIVFRYFYNEIRAAKAKPGFVPLQLGGGSGGRGRGNKKRMRKYHKTKRHLRKSKVKTVRRRNTRIQRGRGVA